MNVLAANFLWWASCIPEWLRLRRSLYRVAETQEQVLFSILARHRNSEWGRRYDFSSIRSVKQYQERVPPADEAELLAESERLLQTGATGLVDEPVLLLEPTSGSSRASRLIPYTASLKAEFQRGVSAWLGELFWRYPSLLGLRSYWSLSPPLPRAKPGAIPVGFDEDADYLSPLARYLFRQVSATPKAIDPEAFWEQLARQLLNCDDLGLISVWSPTFLELLIERLQSLSGGSPEQWWPRLRLVSCWADAQSASPAKRLRSRFPGVIIQPKGLVATEGIVSLPLAGGYPLALRSHFFEFQDDQGRFLLAHQLREGHSYTVLLTTGGGLYRYPLGDRIQVEGRVKQCPAIRFLGRERVSDHHGEKLSEHWVGGVLRELTEGFAMLAYEEGGYVLFVEQGREELQTQLESRLNENVHYRLCRQLGQLRPVRVYLTEEPLEDYYNSCRQRLGDVKLTSLHPQTGWSRRFRGSWLHEPREQPGRSS